MNLPFGLPPEAQAELQRQIELQHAEVMGTRHDVTRFVSEELNEQQLVLLRLMLSHCEGSYADSMEGYITAILQIKYKVCPGCGKNHEEEERQLLAGGPESRPPVTEEVPQEVVDAAKRTFHPVPVDEENSVEPFNREEHLAIYGVRDYTQNDVDLGLLVGEGERPVICINCGMLYQSLEDRMLRLPGLDGCTGCQHKSAHG